MKFRSLGLAVFASFFWDLDIYFITLFFIYVNSCPNVQKYSRMLLLVNDDHDDDDDVDANNVVENHDVAHHLDDHDDGDGDGDDVHLNDYDDDANDDDAVSSPLLLFFPLHTPSFHLYSAPHHHLLWPTAAAAGAARPP